MNWFLVAFQAFNAILGTDTLSVLGLRSLQYCGSTRWAVRDERKGWRTPSSLPTLLPLLPSPGIFFSADEISWLTSKATLHPEEIILVGIRGGRKTVEKQEWDLWTEMSGDGWKPGRYLSPTCHCEAGMARVGGGGEGGVTATSQRSAPVFAGRDIRFRQIWRKWLLVVSGIASSICPQFFHWELGIRSLGTDASSVAF